MLLYKKIMLLVRVKKQFQKHFSSNGRCCLLYEVKKNQLHEHTLLWCLHIET